MPGCKLNTQKSIENCSNDDSLKSNELACQLAQLEKSHLALRERYNQLYTELQLSQLKIIQRDLSYIQTIQKIIDERDAVAKQLKFSNECNARLTTLNIKLNVANRRLTTECKSRNSFMNNVIPENETKESEDSLDTEFNKIRLI